MCLTNQLCYAEVKLRDCEEQLNTLKNQNDHLKQILSENKTINTEEDDMNEDQKIDDDLNNLFENNIAKMQSLRQHVQTNQINDIQWYEQWFRKMQSNENNNLAPVLNHENEDDSSSDSSNIDIDCFDNWKKELLNTSNEDFRTRASDIIAMETDDVLQQLCCVQDNDFYDKQKINSAISSLSELHEEIERDTTLESDRKNLLLLVIVSTENKLNEFLRSSPSMKHNPNPNPEDCLEKWIKILFDTKNVDFYEHIREIQKLTPEELLKELCCVKSDGKYDMPKIKYTILRLSNLYTEIKDKVIVDSDHDAKLKEIIEITKQKLENVLNIPDQQTNINITS